LIEVNATRKLNQDDSCLAEDPPDTASSLDPDTVSWSRARASSVLTCEIQTKACSLVSAMPM
jgi:hypothetical protein